jgi:hypothetical protein
MSTVSEKSIDDRREVLARKFVEVQRFLREVKGWTREDILNARAALHAAIAAGGEDLDSAEVFYDWIERERMNYK